MPKVVAPKQRSHASADEGRSDLSYRVVDSMFTAFYANTPSGEEAWKVIAAQNEGTGKVLSVHVESTIQQLRDAGYTVDAASATDVSDDELMAALAA
jgi:hypothetical protein